MRNSLILTLNFLLISFSSNAYSHTGPHSESWLQSMIHFTTSSDHLPLIIPALLILTFVIAKKCLQNPWQSNYRR